MGPNPTTIGRARESVREFFLLEQAEKTSEGLNASQRDAIRTYHEAASCRISVARDLRGPNQTPAALSLYQQASYFYALAYLVSKDASLDPRTLTPEEAFHKLDGALARGELHPPREFERSRPMLVASDPLELDRLSPQEAGRRIEQLAGANHWLARLLEPRSPHEIKTARVVRVLAGAAAIVALLFTLGVRIFASKNLALHRPATASSYVLNTAAAGAVDGSRSGPFGYHSQLEDSPWLSIDLGGTHAVTRVEIFGRTDGPYDQSIPLVLEISDDGVNYRPAASRIEPFSDYDPWVVKPGAPLVTRYIRLHTMRRSYLVLGEVEVYGSAAKPN